MSSSTARHRLLQVQAEPYEEAPTFLRAHTERLPAEVHTIHGLVPQIGGVFLLPQSVPARAARKVGRTLSGQPWEREITNAYVKAIQRIQPAAVLAEFGPLAVNVEEACRETKTPLVAHFHGYDATVFTVLEEMKAGYARVFESATAVVAVSLAMRNQLINLGAPKNKVYVNHYGVDLKRFGGADPAVAPPRFATIGRFVDKKAPHLTVLAFAKVLRLCPEAELCMIGDGPLLHICKDIAGALGIADNIRFEGRQSHERCSELLRSARCFVQHSIVAPNGDCEGTPNAVLEACASGLPVIATRHAGIPDVIVEQETGLLVDERDVGAMAEAMIELANDPVRAGRLGRKARLRIEDRFSMESSLDRLWSIIEACIVDGQTQSAPEPARVAEGL